MNNEKTDKEIAIQATLDMIDKLLSEWRFAELAEDKTKISKYLNVYFLKFDQLVYTPEMFPRLFENEDSKN